MGGGHLICAYIQEGFEYLAFILDAYSRRLVGWAMADHLRAELVTDALDMALGRRRPAPGLIHHSDRGSQYTSISLGQKLEEADIMPSMGSVADPYDNALAESFVATIKRELLDREGPGLPGKRSGVRSSSLSKCSTIESESTLPLDTRAPQITRRLE